uniref:preprotein-translocase subunit a n=1 Tax=Thalassionema bacillare TaxID=426664 RepID=UPI001EE05977|nr:preprotein-translocase subunit a [Thalassionema bacillare]UHY40465.1 preprotein-translocase subunit a [Thalassionema bacillare]UHY40852.1 preprotein-translocase subunit a [Thalassionema bacillare]UHY41110.1 preprotein-translocase subunit a [Thalassionema bacillare]
MIKIPFRNKTTTIPKRYKSLINEINEFEKIFQELTDIELRTKVFELNLEYQKTKDLSSLITRSFALTREASLRTLGLRHFNVQLMAGLVLNNNKIAEMKTGEGKTLVATLPASLNALTKKGVHIVTVNDYLANRDQVSMGQIFRFLGFDTGLIQSGMTPIQRKTNYKSDITYVTNYELTFDYLRDNMEFNPQNIVLPPFNYCIIDEVDSILIDEAQTPIILAEANNTEPVEKYIFASEIIKYLEVDVHYQIDEKNKNIVITDLGSKQVETITQSKGLFDTDNPWIPFIKNALRAETLFFKDINYIIQNNRIVIVDEFTGRIMPDRTWGEGLHQAIEAKENVPLHPQAETVASITYQNFFLMYPKLSGMTGTGKTSEIEFDKIYKLKVETIPTNNPIQRKDLPDLVYKDQFSKWNAIAKFCNNVSSTGQPILIGTTTVEKSEMLSQLLSEYQLSYQILNAKPENVRRESEIIAQAGQTNSITVATNMAGRGTDIILGGNISFLTQKELYNILVFAKTELLKFQNSENTIQQVNEKVKYTKLLTQTKFELKFSSNNIQLFKQMQIRSTYQKNQLKHQKLLEILKNLTKRYSHKFFSVLVILLRNKSFLKLSDINVLRILQENDRIAIPTISYQCAIRSLLNDLKLSFQKQQYQDSQIVKNFGGLCVIGTERNESRRVDDQLRGRCGRQGDPGLSRFFVSLDDNLLRLFGGDKIQNFMGNSFSDNSPLESSVLSKSLTNAQQKVEERAYQQRKNLFEYDAILNRQRNIIYFERQILLNKESIESDILGYGEQLICKFLTKLQNKTTNIIEISKFFEFLLDHKLDLRLFDQLEYNSNSIDTSELKTYLFQEFWLSYDTKLDIFSVYGEGLNIFRSFEKQITLSSYTTMWKDHLEKTNLLKDAVQWRSYGQKNPLTEYNKEVSKSFQKQEETFMYFTLFIILTVSII